MEAVDDFRSDVNGFDSFGRFLGEVEADCFSDGAFGAFDRNVSNDGDVAVFVRVNFEFSGDLILSEGFTRFFTESFKRGGLIKVLGGVPFATFCFLGGDFESMHGERFLNAFLATGFDPPNEGAIDGSFGNRVNHRRDGDALGAAHGLDVAVDLSTIDFDASFAVVIAFAFYEEVCAAIQK